MKRCGWIMLGLAVMLLNTVSAKITIEVATFQGIGDPLGGGIESWAHGISPDGTVVVGDGPSINTSGNFHEAFCWTKENGITLLGDLPGGDFSSGAGDASMRGEFIIGGSRYHVVWGKAVYWDPSKTIHALEPVSGQPGSGPAYSVSHDGLWITGESRFGGDRRAALWRPDRSVQLIGSLPAGGFSCGRGISADGLVVAGLSGTGCLQDEFNSSCEPFVWYRDIDPNTPGEQSKLIGLGALPGASVGGKALAVSADGRIVVGQTRTLNPDPNSNNPLVGAFRWEDRNGNHESDPGEMIGLGSLPGFEKFGAAQAVSGNGNVIVGNHIKVFGDLEQSKAFIWDTTNGIRDLQQVLIDEFGLCHELNGWHLVQAEGISDDGRTICGTGLNPQGFIEGWVVTFEERCVTHILGDLNCDDRVDMNDFKLMAGNWLYECQTQAP